MVRSSWTVRFEAARRSPTLALWLALTSIGLAIAIFALERQLAPLKTELAELRSVRYGLLDPEAWRAPLARAIAREVGRIADDEASRTELRQTVAQAIGRAIETGGERLIDRLRSSTSPALWQLSGIEAALKRSMQTLAQSEAVRASTERLTDEALTGLGQAAQLEKIEAWVRARLDEALAGQIDPAARERDRARLDRYGNGDRTLAKKRLVERIEHGMRLQWGLVAALAVVMIPILAIAAAASSSLEPHPTSQAAVAAAAVVMLGLALGLPMIEVEARLVDLRIHLSGQALEFQDQLLFYSAKSVWAIAYGLAALGNAGSAAIAALILVFCAALPAAKFTALAATRLRGRTPRSKVALWLVNSSGKWCMADVFVIALLMAYLGFDGLIDHQLARVGLLAPASEAVNATRLGPGIYLFVAHVLIGIALARPGRPDAVDTPMRQAGG